jgi:O-antigen/teichoic acid export membrane protein
VTGRIDSALVAVRRSVGALRQDRLHRTSILLIGDHLALGMFGGLFVVIATHVWAPHSIGVVSAIFGATALIETIAGLGMTATIVANLANEPDQALMVRGALFTSVPVGLLLLSIVWLIPGHLSVPLDKLGINVPTAVFLTMLAIFGSLVGSIVDGAFLARQEVSWTVGKDFTSMGIRFIALAILAGTGTAGYLAVASIYAGSSALIDLGLLRWRLRRLPRRRASLGLRLVWSHASFAVGSQAAVLVSVIPTSLLPLLVLSRLGAAAAAYATIPITIIGILCVIPSMTAQSLFAELAGHPEEFLTPIRRSLRAAYLGTLPAAAIVIIFAPRLLELFGHGYSVEGRSLLRWGAASCVFFCLNYISDFVLLARKRVGAYLFANVVGSAFVFLSLYISIQHGLGGLGLGWFIGQACYCGTSCVVLAKYIGRKNLISELRQMRRSRDSG